MATTAEVVNYLNSNYDVRSSEKLEADSTLVTLLKSWNDGRSQMVFVSISNGFVRVESPVASVDDVNLDALVNVVSENTHWAVRKTANMYMLSNVGVLATTDAEELDVPINLISEAADELEKAAFGHDKF